MKSMARGESSKYLVESDYKKSKKSILAILNGTHKHFRLLFDVSCDYYSKVLEFSKKVLQDKDCKKWSFTIGDLTKVTKETLQTSPEFDECYIFKNKDSIVIYNISLVDNFFSRLFKHPQHSVHLQNKQQKQQKQQKAPIPVLSVIHI